LSSAPEVRQRAPAVAETQAAVEPVWNTPLESSPSQGVSSGAGEIPCSTLADVDQDRSLPPWSIVVGVVAALALIFVLGVGYGQQWGASEWGPLSAWIAGAATFGAVVLALREAARSQRAREIDHEISRRRECIKALAVSGARSSAWAAPLKPSLFIWMVLILNPFQKSGHTENRLLGASTNFGVY
jgi:hypothetical protein